MGEITARLPRLPRELQRGDGLPGQVHKKEIVEVDPHLVEDAAGRGTPGAGESAQRVQHRKQGCHPAGNLLRDFDRPPQRGPMKVYESGQRPIGLDPRRA